MRINVNDPNEFTLENVAKLIASEDDSVHTQFRVTDDGHLFLSKEVGGRSIDNILFRLETNAAYNGYAGIEASKDEEWVRTIYHTVKANYPKPKAKYIDMFERGPFDVLG